MTKEEWIRLNNLLVKDYAKFQQDYIDSSKGRTSKIRNLATRNMGFAVRRVEYYIDNREGSRLLLKEFLADKTYDIEEFFQPNYFLNDMKGFLEVVGITITSLKL